MGHLWQDEGFGSVGGIGAANGDDDWDEGDESLDTSLEDGFDDPEALDGDGGEDEAED